MSIGSRIKECRESLNMTQEELAVLLNVSKGTIGNYESDINYPKIENMRRLFEILKTDANYLFQDEVKQKVKELFSETEKKHIKKYRILDEYGKKAVDSVLEVEYERCTAAPDEPEDTIELKHSFYKVSAGTGFDLDDGDNWETIDVPDTAESRKADFALTIKGDSMEPVYYDGDIVLIREQPAVDIGEIGIFTVNGSGYIKKYGGDRLISLNAAYSDIMFNDSDNIRCCGKVIGRV